MRSVWAFIRRDALIATSYRFQFLFNLTGSLFVVATFYFASGLVDPGRSAEIARYGDYFSFALIGVAGTTILHTGVSGFATHLRVAMTEGTLEMMFATRAPPLAIVVLPCLWSFFFDLLRGAIIIAVGAALFDASVGAANVLGFVVVVMLPVLAYSVFGLLSAAVILVIKRGDPVAWVFAHASTLVAGAYFPISLLPDWLQFVARALPMTYAYDAMRETLLRGASLGELGPALWVLVIFAAVGLPLAAFACRWAIEYARRDGSLGTF